LYRYKGVIPVKGMENKFVFQGVHMLFGGYFTQDKWAPGEKRQGRFIFIGKNLDHDEIRQGFIDCKAKDLRFKVGQEVYVNLEKGFTQGIVMAQWDNGNAYRVLVTGTRQQVWAPEDSDTFIRLQK
jgi:hypothetical protein